MGKLYIGIAIQSLTIFILCYVVIRQRKQIKDLNKFMAKAGVLTRKTMSPAFLKTLEGINERLNRVKTPANVQADKAKVINFNFGKD